MSAKVLADVIGDNAECVGSFKNIAAELRATLKDGDVLVVMGAGDIYKLFDCLGL